MREKMLEMKELKEELAFAQSAVNKARKLDNMSYQSEDRRGKSLDGWESDANINQLRAQVYYFCLRHLLWTVVTSSLGSS